MYKLLTLLVLFIACSCNGPSVSAQTTGNADTVLICKSKAAHAYHRYECKGLKHCTYQLARMTRSQAVAKGFRPCKICYR